MPTFDKLSAQYPPPRARAAASGVAALLEQVPLSQPRFNMRRTIPDPHSLAPDAIMKSAQSDTVLEAANMAQMVGVLQQLGWLATYSHELFTDLTIEAEGSLTRINQLKGRLGRVTERLARVDDALAAASETEIANICAANPGGAAW